MCMKKKVDSRSGDSISGDSLFHHFLLSDFSFEKERMAIHQRYISAENLTC